MRGGIKADTQRPAQLPSQRELAALLGAEAVEREAWFAKRTLGGAAGRLPRVRARGLAVRKPSDPSKHRVEGARFPCCTFTQRVERTEQRTPEPATANQRRSGGGFCPRDPRRKRQGRPQRECRFVSAQVHASFKLRELVWPAIVSVRATAVASGRGTTRAGLCTAPKTRRQRAGGSPKRPRVVERVPAARRERLVMAPRARATPRRGRPGALLLAGVDSLDTA